MELQRDDSNESLLKSVSTAKVFTTVKVVNHR